jgi:hypothetical protein
MGVITAMGIRRRRIRCFDVAIRAFQDAPAADRSQAMRELIQATDSNGPAWYLLGCSLLRNDRTEEAARAFGMAYHRDCNLQTAALLTFACLKARSNDSADIIDQVLATWEEMHRPNILRKVEDRRLLDGLTETTREAPRLSPLGRMIWLVTGPATHKDRRAAVVGTARMKHPASTPPA